MKKLKVYRYQVGINQIACACYSKQQFAELVGVSMYHLSKRGFGGVETYEPIVEKAMKSPLTPIDVTDIERPITLR